MQRYLWVLMGFFLSSTVPAQPKTLYFDPNYATGAPASKVFDEINYIPLETTKESLFGYIGQLVVTDEYYIILDPDTNTIYFFDKRGKFIKKHENKKYRLISIQYLPGKNSLFISGLNKSFNPSQKEVQVIMDNPLDRRLNKFAKAWNYSLDNVNSGNPEETSLPFLLANPRVFDGNLWVFSNIFSNKKIKDSIDYELKIADRDQVLQAYFPYNRHASDLYAGVPGRFQFFGTGSNDTLLFTRPYDYHIYQLTPDSVSILYKVVLPIGNSLPASFFEKTFNNQNELNDYKSKNTGYAWGLQDLARYKNFLFFGLDLFRGFRDRRFLFDETTSQFYNLSKINGDSTNAWLPVLGFGGNIQFNDAAYLYTSVSSAQMFNNKEFVSGRNPVYNKVIKDYFDKSNRDSNPVIIQLKPKETIRP